MDLDFGPFVLRRMLGRGGMSEVFLASRRGRESEPPIVLKRLRPEVARDEEYGRRLALEAQLAARVRHPSLVRLLEYGRVGECHYLAMAQVKGWSLRRLLELSMDRDEPPPLGAALGILDALLGGLSAMHSAKADDGTPRPFLHRDVTPNNVIVDHDARAVLIDYGIAKDVLGPAITMIGKVVGTARYMAPEHRLSQSCTPRADVFSVSRIAFELITARHPWELLSAHRELLRTVFDPPEITNEIAARLPPDLRELVLRGLSLHAEDRYADATEMQAALRATPSWAALRDGAGVEIRAWIESLGLPPDEELPGPVIDSAPAALGQGSAWSPAGRLATPAEAAETRISQPPEAAVLSIPPLPPKKRDSWAAATAIFATVKDERPVWIYGVAAAGLVLLVALALW